VLATALVAAVADPKSFRSGRNFSAWIGIVPKQHSSGGKNRLGNISKQGDRYLRGLFVAGALSVIRYAKIHGTPGGPNQRGDGVDYISKLVLNSFVFDHYAVPIAIVEMRVAADPASELQ
jgi:hypothetical protein